MHLVNMERVNEQRKVQEAIEKRILQGEFGETGQLPTIKIVSEEYGVGTSTAIASMKGLVEKGILSSKQGKGYFVAPFCRSVLVNKYTAKMRDLLKEASELAEILGVDIKSELD